ncbi:MAG TPA: hypothetical protein VLJ44_03535 [Gaiellaceae bacterium]|nr:hypothetical protein [Gaiellaceae bacterium]
MRVLLLPLLALAAVAPASAGAPRRSGLVVWPARATLVAGSATTLHVANHTRASVSVAVRSMGLALDLRGSPRLVRSSAGTPLVSARTMRVVVGPGAVGSIGVRVSAGRGLAPGDRPALVLLTARSAGGAGIGVRVRIGVPVEVRVPGAVRRRLELGALHMRGRRLELIVRNSGNVAERLGRGSVVIEVWRGSRRLATLQPRARDLFPRARGLVEYRVPKRLRGRARVVVRVTVPTTGRRAFSVAL